MSRQTDPPELDKRSVGHGDCFDATKFPLGDAKILPDYKHLKTFDEINNMTAKLIDDSSSLPRESVANPFYFRIRLTRADKIKVALMSVLVVPVRIVFIVIFLFLTWLGCYLGQLGLSPEDMREKPLTGFRRLIQTLSREFVLMCVRSAGFSVRLVGHQATVLEAPLLVAAPHSSFFDTVAAMHGYPLPSAVVRSKSRGMFFFKTILNFTQPVYVKRSDPNSRQNTVREITRRATSKDPWSQVIIFPEGTCTNRSCLITFKLGAFVPGVPVQPVLIRYPNELNTLTWTWDGPTAFQTLWLTLCQLRTNMEIEYMPVYIPSAQEKEDPKLYAENVRQLMAKALGVPVSSYSYDDLKYCDSDDNVRDKTIVCARLQKFLSKNRIQFRHLDDEILKVKAALKTQESPHVTFSEFAHLVGVPSDRIARDFFEVADIDRTGQLDLRCYLAGLWLLHPSEPQRVENAFKAFCGGGDGMVLEDFVQLIWILLELPKSAAMSMFGKLDKECSGKVYLDEFRELLNSSTQWNDIFNTSGESQEDDVVSRPKED